MLYSLVALTKIAENRLLWNLWRAVSKKIIFIIIIASKNMFLAIKQVKVLEDYNVTRTETQLYCLLFFTRQPYIADFYFEEHIYFIC